MHLRSLGLATVAVAVLSLFTPLPANAATSAPTSSPVPSPAAAACDKGAWQPRVQGSPQVKAGDRNGDYLWHDSNGFHLRVTHLRPDRRVYTGVITASSPMRYTPVKLERGDIVKLSPNRRTLSFSFVNYGHIDGADFHTDCATRLTVRRLHIGNRDLSTAHVFLGADKRHPARVPFTLHRVA